MFILKRKKKKKNIPSLFSSLSLLIVRLLEFLSVWNTLQDNWDKLKHHIKTITCDNGVEFSTNSDFSNNELIEFVRTNLYYCHPYRSGERGTNENQKRKSQYI